MTNFSAHKPACGHLEVICGPMFSGKTEELIRRVRRAQIARQKVQIFKHSFDKRYHDKDIVSHSSLSMKAEPVAHEEEILAKLSDYSRVVAIDEVQFFGDGLVQIVSKMVDRGLRVICSGLDVDYKGMPFGPIPYLLAMADDVLKIKAICTVCGAPASKTYRYAGNEEKQVLVGEKELYEARCRVHFDPNDFEKAPYHQQEIPFVYNERRKKMLKDENLDVKSDLKKANDNKV